MKVINLKPNTKGFKIVYEKAVTNEHYMFTNQFGKSFDKLKFVRKDDNLKVFIENEGKDLEVAVLENYYAPSMNSSIVSLDSTTNQEIGYLTQNDGWAYTKLPETSSMGILGYSAIGLGVIGAGIALGGGGGGSSGGNDSTPPASTSVTGIITAGPIVSTNGLKVNLYKADGTLLVENINIDASGRFTTTISGYTGIVIAKIILDTDTNPDYIDEATRQGKDLTAPLIAVGTITAGVSNTLNINPITTIAANKAGISLDANIKPVTTETVTGIVGINTAVGNIFGLTNITTETVTPIINSEGMSQIANNYGIALATLSGIDKVNNGDISATISQIVAQINTTATSNTITQAGEGLLIQGALNSNISVSQLTNILNPSATTIANNLGNDLSSKNTSTLSPTVIANLTDLQIQSLTPTQASLLTASQVEGLSANQIYALGIAGLLDNLTQELSTAQVQALSVKRSVKIGS